MTETKIATAAFLSFPGAFILNISTTDGSFQRIKISKYQLGNIIADGAVALLRRSLNDGSREIETSDV